MIETPSSGTWLRGFLPAVGRMQERIREAIVPLDQVALALPEGGRVLEMGCGEGLVLGRLVGVGRSLVAVDLDHRKVERARARLGPRTDLTFEVDDAFAFLERTECDAYSAVLLVDTLSSFTPEDQDRLLASMLRVLRPGGLFIIKAIDGRVPLKTFLSRMLSGFVYRVLRLSLSQGQQFTYLSAGELTEKLVHLGCRVQCRHLHRERFHPIPHILVIACKADVDPER